MAHREGQKEDGRARILAAAGRAFRQYGYGGLGIDGLARGAGVTSGAFYAHFKSKAAAFREAVACGLREYREAIERLQETEGESWRRRLIDFYMSNRRTCELGESCALQSLSADVARADDLAKEVFESELRGIIAAAEAGMGPGTDRRSEAIALLALLAGGVTLARAVKDPSLSEEIAEAVRQSATRLGG
jgi:TetR/AcrR family transcriptional regulator, transcriptional repressor for nem operon